MRTLILWIVGLIILVSNADVFAEEQKNRGPLASALMSDDFAEKSGLDVRGWISAGSTFNPGSGDGGYNGPITFNDKENELMMNQAYLIMERPVQRSGDSWDLGFRTDLIYGTDAAFNFSRGFDDRWTNNSVSRDYKWAMPQAYVETNLPIGKGLSVKVGHFYTLLGYEVVTAPDNFFYSHSYSMQYGEPFTHWGY
jgi:hypothetical protein